MNKYKVGDKVKIIKYGHPIWRNKGINEPCSFPIIEGDENSSYIDIEPDIVGQIGTISKAEGLGKPHYAIDGPVKYAWYSEDQLEKVLEDTESYHGHKFPKSYFDDEPGQMAKYDKDVKETWYECHKGGLKCEWSVSKPEHEFVDCRSLKTKIKHLLAYFKHKLYNICGITHI